MAVGVIGFMEYDCLAFDAIDNWIHHPQMKSNHKIIEKNYKIVENKADVIFTVSEALMNVFKEKFSPARTSLPAVPWCGRRPRALAPSIIWKTS